MKDKAKALVMVPTVMLIGWISDQLAKRYWDIDEPEDDE